MHRSICIRLGRRQGEYALVVILSALSCSAGCPDGFVGHGGNCYKLERQKLPWREAERRCQDKDAHLAKIDSEKHMGILGKLFLADLALLYKHLWIGGNDIREDGTWIWQDGSRVDSALWHPDEPNGDHHENCMELHYDIIKGFLTNDYKCSLELEYICIRPEGTLETVTDLLSAEGDLSTSSNNTSSDTQNMPSTLIQEQREIEEKSSSSMVTPSHSQYIRSSSSSEQHMKQDEAATSRESPVSTIPPDINTGYSSVAAEMKRDLVKPEFSIVAVTTKMYGSSGLPSAVSRENTSTLSGRVNENDSPMIKLFGEEEETAEAQHAVKIGCGLIAIISL